MRPSLLSQVIAWGKIKQVATIVQEKAGGYISTPENLHKVSGLRDFFIEHPQLEEPEHTDTQVDKPEEHLSGFRTSATISMDSMFRLFKFDSRGRIWTEKNKVGDNDQHTLHIDVHRSNIAFSIGVPEGIAKDLEQVSGALGIPMFEDGVLHDAISAISEAEGEMQLTELSEAFPRGCLTYAKAKLSQKMVEAIIGKHPDLIGKVPVNLLNDNVIAAARQSKEHKQVAALESKLAKILQQSLNPKQRQRDA